MVIIKEFPVNRYWSKLGLIVLMVLLVGASLIAYLVEQSRLTLEQHLTDIQSVETLRTQFNRDVGQTRLIILLSPT